MIDSMLSDYLTGNYSIKMIAEKYGVSGATAYRMLKRVNCPFSKKKRVPASDEERLHKSEARHAKKKKYENCNGLNGYGYAKKTWKGYMKVYAPQHPCAQSDGFVFFHRVLVERHLGRYLSEDEVVHHMNFNKLDNRLENLCVMSRSDHSRLHAYVSNNSRRKIS